MSQLLDLRDKLEDTHSAISKFEAAVAKERDNKSLSATLQSLYNREEVLERRFEEASNEECLDVCSYRLIAENKDSYPLAALTSTLSEFQAAFTVIYNAIKNGPRKRGMVSAEIMQQSSFDFAYSYPGSLGVALTIPNERLLLCDSDLDKAMELFFKTIKAKSMDEVVALGQEVGVASIRKIYTWSKSHTDYGLSAGIEWKRKAEVRNNILIQTPEIKHLQEIISSTSEEEETEISVVGELVGIDTDMHTFHLAFPDAEDIAGKISGDFEYETKFTLPSRYKAKIMKRTKVHYVLEKEDVSYKLLSLKKE